MARTKRKNGADGAPMTTSQMLGSLLKSARDIMRKDKGLNGDLDRLPLLTWIMFLKFLDDLEQQREEETALSGKKFTFLYSSAAGAASKPGPRLAEVAGRLSRNTPLILRDPSA